MSGWVRIGSWQGVTQLAGALIFALGLVPPKAAAPASFRAGAAGVSAPKGSHGGRWHVREIGRFRLPARIDFGPSGALTRTNVGLSAGVNARISGV